MLARGLRAQRVCPSVRAPLTWKASTLGRTLARVRRRSLDCSRHAIERMLERRIVPDEVRAVIDSGLVVEGDLGGRPYPSYLLLGSVSGRSLHVVIG